MKMEVVLLGKRFYEMENNKGAFLILYGDHEETNNKSGISISECPIEFNEHSSVTVFPGRYSAEGKFLSVKDKSGNTKTSIALSNVKFIEELKLTKVI